MSGALSATLSATLRILPMGEAALLLETEGIDAVLELEAVLAPLATGGAGVWATVDDVVPAARTLLLVARPGTDLAALRAAVRAAVLAASRTVEAGARTVEAGARTVEAGVGTVEIRVRYDGPDLATVATMVGLTPDGLVAAHVGARWRVGFGGFAPGFAYLVGGDPRLDVARRAAPRARVPAGAVGLAGRFSGIYPRESPGGWQLIGTTDAPLWDTDRDPPALLTPGTVVRFVNVESR